MVYLFCCNLLPLPGAAGTELFVIVWNFAVVIFNRAALWAGRVLRERRASCGKPNRPPGWDNRVHAAGTPTGSAARAADHVTAAFAPPVRQPPS
jgi:hypothetical protein